MSSTGNPPVRRTFVKAGLAVAAAPAIVTTAYAQKKVTWKFQSLYPKASASFKGGLVVIADELEKRTDGRFTFELLGAGELAKGAEIFNLVRRGVVPIGDTVPSYNLGEAELIGLYAGMPGTCREPWELMHYTKNLGLERAVNEQLRPKGLFMMAEMAYPSELVLKKPITADTNIGSLKLRASGSVLEFLGRTGFASQLVDGPEIYQALATGVVDGAYWGAAQGALSLKFWEVAPIHMKPVITMQNIGVMINIAAFEKLPDEFKSVLVSLLEERYYQRSIEYQHLEAVALTTGVTTMNVKVERFPDSVLARMSAAAQEMLAEEMKKGPKAKEYGEKLQALMKDLGYV